MWLYLYVDDLIIFWNDTQQKNQLKKHLMQTFRMKDIGAAKSVLGMRITRNDNKISIDQSHYIRQMLDKFGMADCNPLSAPTDVNQTLSSDMCPKTQQEKEEMAKVPYQEAVGSLLFASQVPRSVPC